VRNDALIYEQLEELFLFQGRVGISQLPRGVSARKGNGKIALMSERKEEHNAIHTQNPAFEGGTQPPEVILPIRQKGPLGRKPMLHPKGREGTLLKKKSLSCNRTGLAEECAAEEEEGSPWLGGGRSYFKIGGMKGRRTGHGFPEQKSVGKKESEGKFGKG